MHIELKPQISNADFEKTFKDIKHQLAKPKKQIINIYFRRKWMDVIYNQNQIDEYNRQKERIKLLVQAKKD